MYEKEDATIISINRNMKYLGKQPHKPSKTMDYWGSGLTNESLEQLTPEQIDAMLESAIVHEERFNAASHVITLQLIDTERELSLESAGDINSLDHGYAISVHKAQGSEWRKVYFISSETQAKMLSRELVYTAITRAREHLYVLCNPKMLENTKLNQRIKGETLAEKAEYFKGKYQEQR